MRQSTSSIGTGEGKRVSREATGTSPTDSERQTLETFGMGL